MWKDPFEAIDTEIEEKLFQEAEKFSKCFVTGSLWSGIPKKVLHFLNFAMNYLCQVFQE